MRVEKKWSFRHLDEGVSVKSDWYAVCDIYVGRYRWN